MTTEVVIGRLRVQVSAYAASPDNAPSWYGDIKSVEWKTPPPASVGSRIAFVSQFLGRRMAYTYEIVEFIPNERLVMRMAEGPFPMETQYAWEIIDGGSTRMRLRNKGTPTGGSRFVVPFMARAVRRANQKALSLLKLLLEDRVD